MKESDILREVCEYLTSRGHFFWRNNTAPPVQKFADGSMRFRRMPPYSKKGTPDIILIKDGAFVGIEIKRPGASLSQEQKDFQEECRERRIPYVVVRSASTLEALGL